MTTADQRYGQSLWYAWGRIDSGQYQGTMDTDDGFRFAEEQRDAQQAYNDGKTHCLESIIGAWSQYVERKRNALALPDESDTDDYRTALREKEGRVRAMIEEGRVRTWADGFGRWYALVPSSLVHPQAVARMAIRTELAARVDPDIPLPKVDRAPDYDDDRDPMSGGRHAYREAD